MLEAVYPEYEWLPWRFQRVSKNFWNENENKKKFMDWAGKQLNIKDMSDWYKVTSKVIFPINKENDRYKRNL